MTFCILAARDELAKTGKGLITHTCANILLFLRLLLSFDGLWRSVVSKQASSGALIRLSYHSSDPSSKRSGILTMPRLPTSL